MEYRFSFCLAGSELLLKSRQAQTKLVRSLRLIPFSTQESSHALCLGAPPSMKIADLGRKSFIFSMGSDSFHSTRLIGHYDELDGVFSKPSRGQRLPVYSVPQLLYIRCGQKRRGVPSRTIRSLARLVRLLQRHSHWRSECRHSPRRN